MAPLEKLLADVSKDKVCGEDLKVRTTPGPKGEEELSLLEKLLERVKLVQTTKDQQGDEIPAYGRARPTSDSRDWKGISEEASDLLRRSKDLRLVLIVCLGLLKTKQLAGFKEGLSFLHKLLEKYWDNLYPSNPRKRVNILNSFSLPATRVDSPYHFVQTLRAVPLALPANAVPVSLNDVRTIEKACVKEPDKAAAHRKKITDAFSSSPPAGTKETYDLLTSSLDELGKIREYMSDKESRPDFSHVEQTLNEMASHLEPYAKLDQKQESQEKKPAGNEIRVGGKEGNRASAKSNVRIESLDDVVAALGEICQYYEIHDRSSPVPLLLKRVERLARMDFSEIMEEMTPEEIAKLKTNLTKEETQPTTQPS